MAKLKEMDLPIEGMHCASCVLSLNKTFEKVEGVESVDADLASNKLHLTVNPKKLPFDVEILQLLIEEKFGGNLLCEYQEKGRKFTLSLPNMQLLVRN